MVSRVLWIRLHASARRAPQRRSVKRKLDQEDGRAHLDPPAGGSAFADVAQAADMAAIREALERQQRSIQKLCAELDGERDASSTAANEAMLMILRLQREKAEVQMEFSQFKRFAEEKMYNDQRDLAARDYLLYKRDEALRSLYSELHAYQRRLLSYPEIPDAAAPRFADLPAYDYPKLKCKVSLDLDPDSDDDEYTFGDEEEFQSYFWVWNGGQEFNKGDEFPITADGRPLDDGGSNDDSSDRVYNLDAVHRVPRVRACDGYAGAPREKRKRGVDGGEEEVLTDISKPQRRLQALEADGESIKEAAISTRTENNAQKLRGEVAPERRTMKKKPSITGFSIISSLIKRIMPFGFWRKKATQSKYTFERSKSNIGLLLLLDEAYLVS